MLFLNYFYQLANKGFFVAFISSLWLPLTIVLALIVLHCMLNQATV